jgi:hypothetical protein
MSCTLSGTVFILWPLTLCIWFAFYYWNTVNDNETIDSPSEKLCTGTALRWNRFNTFKERSDPWHSADVVYNMSVDWMHPSRVLTAMQNVELYAPRSTEMHTTFLLKVLSQQRQRQIFCSDFWQRWHHWSWTLPNVSGTYLTLTTFGEQKQYTKFKNTNLPITVRNMVQLEEVQRNYTRYVCTE